MPNSIPLALTIRLICHGFCLETATALETLATTDLSGLAYIQIEQYIVNYITMSILVTKMRIVKCRIMSMVKINIVISIFTLRTERCIMCPYLDAVRRFCRRVWTCWVLLADPRTCGPGWSLPPDRTARWGWHGTLWNSRTPILWRSARIWLDLRQHRTTVNKISVQMLHYYFLNNQIKY